MVATVLIASAPAYAATYTWTGAVNTLWSEAGNWNPSTPPATGDDLVFPTPPANATLTNDLPLGTAFRSIEFHGGPYVVNGNAIGVTAAVSVPQPEWQATTFNAPLSFEGPASSEVRFDGSLVLNGPVNLRSQLMHVAFAQVTIRGDVSGDGPILIANGSSLELYGNDSCSGPILMQGIKLVLMGSHTAGPIVASKGRVVGTGPVGSLTIAGATLDPGGLGTGPYGDPIAITGRLTATDLTLSSGGVHFQIDGPDAGVSYDQINVLNRVQLGNMPMNSIDLARWGANPYTPAPGTVFKIIENNSAGPISGKFMRGGNILPERAIVGVACPYSQTCPMRLSYEGGDGNDITLTELPIAASTTTFLTPSTQTVAAGKPLHLSVRVATSGPAPAGNVKLFSDGNLLATVPVSEGHSWFSTSSLTLGEHQIMAEFEGDALCSASTSSPFNVTVVAVPTVRGDFNADGRADVLWTNATTLNTAVWFMAGMSPPSGEPLLPSPAAAGTGWKAVRIADFNWDGYADVLSHHSQSGRLYISYMKGSSSFGNEYMYHPDKNVVALDDFDGNGFIDIQFMYNQSSVLSTLLRHSVAYSTTIYPLSFAGERRPVGSGDLDGDGKAEMVWRDDTAGEVCWTHSSTVEFGPFVAPGWQVAAVADFDGDGQADLFWRNGVTGDDAIWIMSGGEVFASATMPTVPNQAWQVATFGDYDGNGKTDLFWHNGLTGDNSIWLMNGVGPPVGAAMPPVYDTNWKPVRP